MPRKGAKSSEVREPVQVYLTTSDRSLLDQVAAKAGLSRAEVLRRGLRRIGAEVLADDGPVLALVEEMARDQWPTQMPKDVAMNHDRYLADDYADTGSRRKR